MPDVPKAPKGIPREHPNAASSHMGDRCVAATSLRCCGGTPGDQDDRGTNELSKIESILGTRMSQNLSRDRRLACAKKWPQAAQQRCWVHKTANVLNKVPKSVQPKVKAALHEIWMAETRESAYKAFDRCVRRFEAKYPKAMECLVKDKESLLAFYDFPAAHWQHIRTTNPIESVFATVRLRTMKTKNCGNRMTTLAMAWKLMETAQNKWRRLRGYKLLAEMVEGVKFKDGERVEDHSQGTVETAVHQI